MRPEMAGQLAVDLRVLDLRCPCCTEKVLEAVLHLPGVGDARLDFSSGRLHAELDSAIGSEARVRAAVSAAGYRVADQARAPSTGELAHDADLAPITCGTKCDRMQYEMPHGRAQLEHREPCEYPKGGMGGMDHDMSDPRMAAAMERDMRNRFLIALLLTIPVIVFAPLGYNTFGIRPVHSQTARNLIGLVLSRPVVWYAGWTFIAGADTSLRSRALNMSVLVATGVLAAWLGSVALTILGQETSLTRPRCW